MAPDQPAGCDHIGDPVTLAQKAVFLLNFQQFIRSSRAKTLVLGALVEVIFALVAGRAQRCEATAWRTHTRPLVCPGTPPRTNKRF